ncbi:MULTISPECIES: hypothetical protein [Corallococcus]|uniref:Uncharacterized protein n=3 Tax=Corallococcus TaxID=83461 RepID=A0A3A8KG61_9BACT|nr:MULTISPECIES: hypothetical protein [Corallococcus]RKI37506.1 hypothetical protein D7Y27_25455 [Corallococcus sp. AB004]MBN8472645.1 hypothetical protein [Corallococcus exiguus]NOJ93288.1 hypothetical protein [Corallococcus coralloides]NOK16401.1 hypothetical protein [Corallococcus carmarthensis]NPC73392.1 hypothetical protein [Corallococcus exiguus]
MASNKGPPVKGPERTDTHSAEELEREARHQRPGTERGDVTDEDVGEDRILQKGIGGYGAQKGTEPAREAPPLSDDGDR